MSRGVCAAAVWSAAVGAATALSAAGVPAAPLLAGLAVFFIAGRRMPDLPSPAPFAVWGRSAVGAAAGSLVTWSALASLGVVVVWASVVSVAAMVAGALIGLAVASASGMSRSTAVVASMPGGLSEMLSLAEESELDVAVVTAAHLARRVGMVAVAFAVVAVV